jgi:hypothetical protein
LQHAGEPGGSTPSSARRLGICQAVLACLLAVWLPFAQIAAGHEPTLAAWVEALGDGWDDETADPSADPSGPDDGDEITDFGSPADPIAVRRASICVNAPDSTPDGCRPRANPATGPPRA